MIDEQRWQNACRKLDLPGNATIEEVEERFRIAVRKVRAQQLRGEWGHDQKADWNEKNAAYRALREENDKIALAAYRKDRYSKYGRFAAFAERADNFWYYYKSAVIGLSVAVVLVTVLLYGHSQMNRNMQALAELPPADLSVMVFGDFGLESDQFDRELTAQKLLERIPEWRRIEARIFDVPKLTDNRTNIAKNRLATVALATERPDVYILDEAQFLKLLQMGYLRKFEPSGEYAVPMSNGPLSEMLSLTGSVVAAVSVFSEQPHHAELFIERYRP